LEGPVEQGPDCHERENAVVMDFALSTADGAV